jgi:organic radical activating enzyme
MRYSTLIVRQNNYLNFEQADSKDLSYMGGEPHSEVLQAEFVKWYEKYKKAGFDLTYEFSGTVVKTAMFVKHHKFPRLSEYIHINYDGFTW